MGIIEQFSLKGKTALVTGCNKGIGKAMALGLAEAGADILGVSASLELSGSAVEKEVTALGRSFKAYQADLSSRDSLYDFVTKVTKNGFKMLKNSYLITNFLVAVASPSLILMM